ncbi:uncharacterized protein LOC134182208 [Corticium candelabrum]|uniref:uncharacterized protein LOC134182208 n=1 Tax=Corticium candelabrum TaxID=121492 RepID=UPI002E2663C9|nr:uncharacterized protein LOC134182208 [Corticium candelabrum]
MKKQLDRVAAMNEKRLKLRPFEEEGGPLEPECHAKAGTETLDGDSDSVQSVNDEDVWSCLDDWIRALRIVDTKMLLLLLFEFYRRETSQTVKRAVGVVSQIVHKNEGTIRDWRNNFRCNCGKFLDGKGHYQWSSIMHDEECRRKATRSARQHSCTKGRPNITASDFCCYINTDLLPNTSHTPGFSTRISVKTACRFLCDLGF